MDFLGSNGQVIAPPYLQQQNMQGVMPQQYQAAQQMVNMAALETPKITSSSMNNNGGGFKFKIAKDGEQSSSSVIHVDAPVSDMDQEAKKRTPRKKKETGGEIIRSGDDKPLAGTVEETPTIYSYMETNGLLHETLGQIDSLNSELMQEFNNVRHSRTMKNKYNVLVGLSENVGSLINNRISVIKEINSTITKSNDVDYKKEKDRRAATANVDDDKYIADLYKSFMQNPMNVPQTPQLPQVDPSIYGSSIIRADIRDNGQSGGIADASYLSYVSNLSPEQNMMRYENNGNVKQVVVYDEATGNKFFQVMDISTGQVIPNVPVYDQMFMEDTTLNLDTMIAKNINLNETFPIIVINQGVKSQY